MLGVHRAQWRGPGCPPAHGRAARACFANTAHFEQDHVGGRGHGAHAHGTHCVPGRGRRETDGLGRRGPRPGSWPVRRNHESLSVLERAAGHRAVLNRTWPMQRCIGPLPGRQGGARNYFQIGERGLLVTNTVTHTDTHKGTPCAQLGAPKSRVRLQ